MESHSFLHIASWKAIFSHNGHNKKKMNPHKIQKLITNAMLENNIGNQK